jgi:hypothetical protein
MVTDDERGQNLAARFESMSPEARRLFLERSRWRPDEDGSVTIQVTAEAGGDDALLELALIFREELGVELRHPPPSDAPPARGPGLTFEEMGRRHLDTSK